MQHYLIEDYTPHKNQALLHRCKAKEILVISSIRAGKTYGIMYDAIKSAWNNDTGHGILVTAPSYRLLKAVLETPMVGLLKRYGLLSNYNGSDHEATLKNGNIIYFRSLEEPDTAVRGLNISKAYIDETSLCKKYAVDLVKGRLVTTNGTLVMITTPKGTDSWIYEDYIENKEKHPDTAHITFNIFDNPIITEESVERYKESLDPLMFDQEILGLWVNLLTDRIYHCFSEENVKVIPRDPNLPIYIGVDFNLGVNAWTVFQKRADNTIVMLDEGHGTTTTGDLGRQILERYGSGAIVIPDATGSNKLQGDASTHFQLLRQAGVSNIVENRSNPKRTLRYANVNALLLNGKKQRRLFINPKCKKTLAEIRKLAYKKGSTDFKPAFDPHFTDSVGYAMFYLTGNVVGQILNPSTGQSDFVRNFQRKAQMNMGR